MLFGCGEQKECAPNRRCSNAQQCLVCFIVSARNMCVHGVQHVSVVIRCTLASALRHDWRGWLNCTITALKRYVLNFAHNLIHKYFALLMNIRRCETIDSIDYWIAQNDASSAKWQKSVRLEMLKSCATNENRVVVILFISSIVRDCLIGSCALFCVASLRFRVNEARKFRIDWV